MKSILRKIVYAAITVIFVFSLLGLCSYSKNEASDVVLRISYFPLVLLIVGMAVLIPFEKKIGYFSFLFAPVRHLLVHLRELYVNRKWGQLLLHGFNLLFTVIYVAMLASFIMFGVYSRTSILLSFFGSLVAVSMQLICRIVSGKGRESATLFLVIAILVGMMLCYTMPVQLGVSWDDETHFRRAFNLVHQFSDQISVSEYHLISLQYSLDDYIQDPAAAVQNMVELSDSYVPYDPGLCNPYTAISYLPIMLVMTFASILHYDLVTTLVVCRLANLVTYALVIWFGIRKLKSGAMIFSAVALLPSALFLACSINYDFWLTAWLAFALAHLISVLQTKDGVFATKDMVAILVGLFLACAPKAIYCFLFLPLLFLPKARFADSKAVKRFRVCVIITVLFIAATLVIPGLIVPDLYTDNRGGADVSTGGQISFILSNPFRYVGILLKFLGEFCSLTNLNTFGTYYAYLGYPYVFFGTIAAFMLLYTVYTDRHEDDNYEGMQSTRWWMLFTVFAQLVLVVTSLYVGFTPVGSQTINGCSYRYIFPLLIPFCFFMAPKGIRCKINKKFQNAFVYGGLAVNLLFSFFNVYLIRFIG